MLSSAIPTKFPLAWGASAGAPYITTPVPVASQISVTAGRASFTDGYVPLNMTPVNAGGVPPFGQDQNGILNMITLWNQWQQAGGPVTYDATFATGASPNIGGYPKGAELTSSDLTHLWVSTTEGNTSNPDTGGANWRAMPQAIGPTGSTRNLVGSSPGNVKAALWTADQITASIALSGTAYLGTTVTLSFNGANIVSGTAGGMDTGAIAANGTLHIYAMLNPSNGSLTAVGTITGSGATCYPGVNAPSGYTASCLLWSGIVNGSGFLPKFYQHDQKITIASTNIFVGATGVTSYTAQSLSVIVPPNAKSVGGQLGTTAGGAVGTPTVAPDSAGNVGIQQGVGVGTGIANYTPGTFFVDLMLVTPQTIFWFTSTAASNSWTMSIQSYTI